MTARLNAVTRSDESGRSTAAHPGVTPAAGLGPPPGWPTEAPPADVSPVPPGWESVVSPPELQPTASQMGVSPAEASIDEFPGWAPPPQPPAPATPAQRAVGSPPPAASEAPVAESAEGPPLPSETEWTWMEAAAAAWLARRESDEGGEESGDAPHVPDPQS
jgi:hypothetical protein